MTLFTLNLSDLAAQAAFLRASSRGQSVDEFVSSIVEDALMPEGADPLEKAACLTDDEVVAMADYQLPAPEQERLNQLLELNGEGALLPHQQSELDSLMRLYHEGMLRKSIGWAEAVRRELRNPPEL